MYNYQKAYLKFLAEWEKQEKTMRRLGMSDEKIQAVHHIWIDEFANERKYYRNNISLDENVAPPHYSFTIFEGWEDQKIQKLFEGLSQDDIDICMLYFVDGLTLKEIATKKDQSKQNISKKLIRIKKLLKRLP